MRVHLVQHAADIEAPLGERVTRTAQLVADQRRAELVVLPELWPSGGFRFDAFADEAEPVEGAVTAALAEAARTAGAWVHGGSFVERAPDGRLFNTAVLLDPGGRLAARYRKVHLFGFSEGETQVLSAGDDAAWADVAVSEGTVRAGLVTCYDLRFPGLFGRLVDAGVGLMVVPAAWPAARAAHWRLLVQARAVECQCWVVAVNTAGEQAGMRYDGGSLVVDPWGQVVAEAGVGEEVLVADVDLALVARTRAEFPVLADRVAGLDTGG